MISTTCTRENMTMRADYKPQISLVKGTNGLLFCALWSADFLQQCLSPRATLCTISFCISNSFGCKSDFSFRWKDLEGRCSRTFEIRIFVVNFSITPVGWGGTKVQFFWQLKRALTANHCGHETECSSNLTISSPLCPSLPLSATAAVVEHYSGGRSRKPSL